MQTMGPTWYCSFLAHPHPISSVHTQLATMPNKILLGQHGACVPGTSCVPSPTTPASRPEATLLFQLVLNGLLAHRNFCYCTLHHEGCPACRLFKKVRVMTLFVFFGYLLRMKKQNQLDKITKLTGRREHNHTRVRVAFI